MKKIIAREFLWFLVILVLAVPISFLLLNTLDIVAQDDFFTETEKTFVAELYLLCYVFCFVGLYLMRFIVLAIQILASKEAPASK